jgi:hypothetical protein
MANPISESFDFTANINPTNKQAIASMDENIGAISGISNNGGAFNE